MVRLSGVCTLVMSNFQKGDLVEFIPEYKDGDTEFVYVLIEEPDGGRVKVVPYNSRLEIPPIQVVKTEWLVKYRTE